MATLKPAYLIHGDDHGAISERRASLRALAESDSDGGVELLEGEAATPARVAQALAAMTLTVGRRVIIVEGVERWRPAEFDRDLAPALRLNTGWSGGPPPNAQSGNRQGRCKPANEIIG